MTVFKSDLKISKLYVDELVGEEYQDIYEDHLTYTYHKRWTSYRINSLLFEESQSELLERFNADFRRILYSLSTIS